MSYVSHTAGENRVFDPLYDPLFIVAGKKDAWRANTYALSKSAPIHVLSRYNLMFSDLPKESRSIYWRQENLLPHFRLEGGGDATDQKFGRTSKLPQEDIVGRYRGCFFQHTGDSAVINLKLNLPDSSEDEEECIPKEKNKNVGCQTIYRESSAQTRPYQPEAILGPGQIEEPEVLRISRLITGDNQPGEFETKIIERARRRRQWEKELTPVTAETDIERRNVVLEAFEWEEWLSREEEIEDVQNMRLELVIRLLDRRNRCFALKSFTKLQNSTKRIEEKRAQDLQKLQRSHERKLRKLEAKHYNISKKYRKENIVEEHINRSSELYGPQMRFGVNPSRRHYVHVKKKFCARLDDLDKKIKDQPSLVCPVSKFDRLAKPKEVQKEITQGFRRDSNLKKLYEDLKSLRSKDLHRGTPKCLAYREVIIEAIPPTPIGVECDNVAEADYQASVYLQKIIKGRAIQNMLYKGKEIHRNLIDELRSTKMLKAISAIFPEEEEKVARRKFAAHRQQKKLKEILHSKEELNDVLNKSEASVVCMLLDFLEKELKRLYEQRKIHAIYMLAERERKKREAFEAGKRQRENKRRREHEEIYKNLTKTSQDTATLYLENVLIEETHLKAEKDARKKIEAMAKRIDLEANRCGQIPNPSEITENSEDGDENIIAELVKDFVFPEVQKRLARRRNQIRQQRYLLAAHQELFGHIENVLPRDVEIDERPEVANEILTELINKAVDSEDALTELCPQENVAHHEAMAAIRKIIKRVLPGKPKWKTSAERIVSATISELTHIAVTKAKHDDEEANISTPKSDYSKLLHDTISAIKMKLWTLAVGTKSKYPLTTSNHVQHEPINIRVIPENYDFTRPNIMTQRTLSGFSPFPSEVTINQRKLGTFSNLQMDGLKDAEEKQEQKNN